MKTVQLKKWQVYAVKQSDKIKGGGKPIRRPSKIRIWS